MNKNKKNTTTFFSQYIITLKNRKFLLGTPGVMNSAPARAKRDGPETQGAMHMQLYAECVMGMGGVVALITIYIVSLL